MSTQATVTPVSGRLASELTGLLRTAERPIVAVVHELLKLAAQGFEVRANLSPEQDAIEVHISRGGERTETLERHHWRVPRAGVKFRSLCARLAKLCRKPDGTTTAVYRDAGVIPKALIDDRRTLEETDPMSTLDLASYDDCLAVEYQNDKRWPLGIRISPAQL